MASSVIVNSHGLLNSAAILEGEQGAVVARGGSVYLRTGVVAEAVKYPDANKSADAWLKPLMRKVFVPVPTIFEGVSYGSFTKNLFLFGDAGVCGYGTQTVNGVTKTLYAISIDSGATWHTGAVTGTVTFSSSLTWNGTVLLDRGSSPVKVTTDFVTWTDIVLPAGLTYIGLVAGYFVGHLYGRYVRSTDGVTWLRLGGTLPVEYGTSVSQNFTHIKKGNEWYLFYAGQPSITYPMYKTDDFITWVKVAGALTTSPSNFVLLGGKVCKYNGGLLRFTNDIGGETQLDIPEELGLSYNVPTNAITMPFSKNGLFGCLFSWWDAGNSQRIWEYIYTVRDGIDFKKVRIPPEDIDLDGVMNVQWLPKTQTIQDGRYVVLDVSTSGDLYVYYSCPMFMHQYVGSSVAEYIDRPYNTKPLYVQVK